VKVIINGDELEVSPLTANRVVMEAHGLSQPVRLMRVDDETIPVPITLPHRVATLFLSMTGQTGLPRLQGICRSPLLDDSGGIRLARGYDQQTGFWCDCPDAPQIGSSPSRSDADQALMRLRQVFATFSFSDSPRRRSAAGIEIVDLSQPPGLDESSFLSMLMTAVCRASLPLAPAALITAPSVSGSGEGKGLLVSALAKIAYDVVPRSFSWGTSKSEFEKRLAAALVKGCPIVSVDNVNALTLQSDLLAQVLTERVIETRTLGTSEMKSLCSTAMVTVTGNGTVLAEDLVRRFMVVRLNSGLEEAYRRKFEDNFEQLLATQRVELLEAVLTIWRWGRQSRDCNPRGMQLGSFAQWASWCRDPLIALGCRDPVERIAELRREDPVRDDLTALFELWHHCHGDLPVTLAGLAPEVLAVLNPGKRSGNWVTNRLTQLKETRVGGYRFERLEKSAKWSFHRYRVTRQSDAATMNLD
jgi:hypothetical protein